MNKNEKFFKLISRDTKSLVVIFISNSLCKKCNEVKDGILLWTAMEAWWWDNYKSRRRWRHSSPPTRVTKNDGNMSLRTIFDEYANREWINYDQKVTSCDSIKNLNVKREIFIYDKFATSLIKFSLCLPHTLSSHTFFYDDRKEKKQKLFTVFCVFVARFAYQIHDLNNKTPVNMKLLKLQRQRPKLTERHLIS